MLFLIICWFIAALLFYGSFVLSLSLERQALGVMGMAFVIVGMLFAAKPIRWTPRRRRGSR